jgi:hypothetical protein
MNSKVSFDFDATLSRKGVQKFAKKLKNLGCELFIVTSRYEDPSRYDFPTDHKDLFRVAAKLGIDKDHMVFTNFQHKYKFLMELGVFCHVDDDIYELLLLSNMTVKGYDVNDPYYTTQLLMDLRELHENQ